jgi:hypothetical protein
MLTTPIGTMPIEMIPRGAMPIEMSLGLAPCVWAAMLVVLVVHRLSLVSYGSTCVQNH